MRWLMVLWMLLWFVLRLVVWWVSSGWMCEELMGLRICCVMVLFLGIV